MSLDREKYDTALASTRDYWDRRARETSDDCARVEWSRRGQLMRFEMFVKFHGLAGATILDVGCGTGELLEHLRSAGIACDYTGFDLSPEMINRCRERFPGEKFYSGDFLNWNPGRKFDYTVSIGIHNIKVENGQQVMQQTLLRQYELCTRAAHASLLTSRYAEFAPHIQSWRAADVLEFALDITPFVVLRHDYLPNDFSVTLYREPLIETRSDLRLD